MTLAAVDSWGGQQGEALGVAVPGPGPGEPHRPLAACGRAPADGRIVLHKRLQTERDVMNETEEDFSSVSALKPVLP